MTETYSVAQTGRRADSPYTVANVILPDSSARPAGMAAAMMTNAQVLCKNPDGSQSYYVIDAERSTASDVVLRRV